MIASNFNEILEKLDFTDSIITEIRWENNLLDLVLVVDYYWDIQEGKEKTRMLKIIFKSCLKADFQMTHNLVEIPDKEIQSHFLSWYTIIGFRKADSNYKNSICVKIFTTDYSNPWLTVVSKSVKVEEIEY